MKKFYQIVAKGKSYGRGIVQITSEYIYDSPEKAESEIETFKRTVAIDDIHNVHIRTLQLKNL